MNKSEFIDRLKNALNGRVAPDVLQENLSYYEDYINTQIRMGRSEQDVLDTLGDPRWIAKTIIETSGGNRTDTYAGESYRSSAYEQSSERKSGTVRQGTNKTIHMPGWVWVIISILVIVLIFSVVFSVLSFLAPILLPLFVVIFLVKLFRDWLN